MNILVIAGSPKGKDSITLHTCLCLEKKFPGHRFTYLYAGTRVKALEKDFSPALEAIEAADLLVFCYPVYTFLVPSLLHRFIEKMKESGKDFSGKAATVAYAMETLYTPSQNFLGVGGMKIFRDLIYMMRGLMRADHKFFKSHGQYDFPQKEWKTSWMMYLVGWMMNSPKMKAKMGGKMSEGMIAPYKKMLEEAEKESG